jgi:rsbT co-antagonist protein RsbR
MNNQTAQLLQKNRNLILEKWMALQVADHTLRENLISNQALHSQSEELLDGVLRVSASPSNLDPIAETLGDLSLSRARQGFSAGESSTFLLTLKTAILQVLETELTNAAGSLYSEAASVHQLFDKLNVIGFEAFIKGREEVILRQTDEISEISTPVIRVWDGVVALPIIGTLDSARTQVVMENLLQEIVATGSSIAILDISGVPAVDSLVAQHLIKTVSATRLMGAECIISGIRAEIAQTIVHLGIDLSHIKTKATLASALKLAFSMLNVEVIKRADKRTDTLTR